MDLRPFIKDTAQLQTGIRLIQNRDLFYQPFILSDDVEVGEGMNFCNKYANVDNVFDLNAYAKGIDLGERKQPSDLSWFRKCNQEYRQIYEYLVDQIAKNSAEPIQDLDFCEIGCNTGLTLFMLAKAGARSCTGVDWNEMSPVFNWLNDVLGTRVSFRKGIYSNLRHAIDGFDVKPVDIMINTVFLNHQCDPLQFLCYICDRAKKGVFLWVLIEDSRNEDDCFVRYPATPPHKILDTKARFPLSFNNDVRLSEPLLRVALSKLGFSDVRPVERYLPSEKWMDFQSGFKMYYAKRTSNTKSAYWESDVTQRLRTISVRLRSAVRRLLGAQR